MKMEIYLSGKRLVAMVHNPSDDDKVVIGESQINAVLNRMYSSLGKSFAQLIIDGDVVIKDDIWNVVDLKDNKYFVKNVVSKTKTSSSESITRDTVHESIPVGTFDGTTSEVVEDVVEDTDKSIDDDSVVEVVEETSEEKKEKRKKRIKKLKVYAKVAAAVLLVGGIVCGGLHEALKNSSNNSKSNNETPRTIEDENLDFQTTVNMSDEEVLYAATNNSSVDSYNGDTYGEYGRYLSLGSTIVEDDMEVQIQAINDICFGYQPCTLYNLVVESDKNAIFVINDMRNRVLNNSCDAEAYLHNVVNYLFESGTTFDGKVIKSYDSLSPYAQYIVLTASQSILQLCPTYEHTTPNNNYNYSMLTNSFDYMVDIAYRQLVGLEKIK